MIVQEVRARCQDTLAPRACDAGIPRNALWLQPSQGAHWTILPMQIIKALPRAPATGARPLHLSPSKRLSWPHEVLFELPRPGQLRIRRLVHRGAPRPVSKFHSLKLRRVVQCESRLEVEVAMLLDACPAVTTFAEQPLALHYFDQGAPRYHMPDFRFQAGTYRELIEVKFEADIDDEIRRRTKLLTDLLEPYGWRYRVITEGTIRSGHLLDNVQRLLRRGRQRPPEHWSLATFDRIRRNGPITLGEFGWDQTGQIETSWISHEILVGNAYVDLNRKLSTETQLHVERPDLGGALPWLLAHSK